MTTPTSKFQQAALVSGLLAEEQIEAATAALRHDAKGEREGKAEREAKGEKDREAQNLKTQSQQPVVTADDRDAHLAAKLVELGYLNLWQSDQLLQGRVKWNLGPYRIVDAIGQGGMGQVFKAEHTIMRRIVAIKVLPLARSNPDSIDNFRREIQAQAQLDHENLVRAYDAGQDGNVHFLVTEYVPGQDLRRLIKRAGKLNHNAAAAIVCQAARGLDHAHSRGLIHRDVKPGNLLVTPEGQCKVSDLGLAGFLHEEDDARKNKTVGTVDYLSPEQILTPNNLTAACDIYSLGCTLYYSVTGKVPFPGGSTSEKARAHCHEQPIDPRRLNPDLDAAFVDVIGDMMLKDPKTRINAAAEVIRRLQPWAGDNWPTTVASGGTARPATGAAAAFTVEAGEMGTDTQPLEFPAIELPELEERESPSQVSQTTLPMGATSEETAPLEPPFRLNLPRPDGLSLMVILTIGLAVVAALVVMGAILIKVLL